MVMHIVLWDIKEKRVTIKNTIKDLLENLVGVVPGLISAKVVTDPMEYGNTDVALVAELEDEAALKGYQVHPAHVEAGKYVREHVCNRKSLDFQK